MPSLLGDPVTGQSGCVPPACSRARRSQVWEASDPCTVPRQLPAWAGARCPGRHTGVTQRGKGQEPGLTLLPSMQAPLPGPQGRPPE